MSHWERASVLRLRDELERQNKIDVARKMEEELARKDSEVSSMPRTAAPSSPSSSPSPLKPPTARDVVAGLWSVLNPFNWRSNATFELPFQSHNLDMPSVPAPEGREEEKLPLLRKEYDLRPYGLGVLIDFGWSREESLR